MLRFYHMAMETQPEKDRGGEGEWEFLTFDPDESCRVCGRPIRPAQAVGRLGASMIHARCADKSATVRRPPTPPSDQTRP